MLISPTDLTAQYKRAVKAWPFLPTVEKNHGLPPFLLFAVGSRETNLTNEVGDGGHGRGVFQLDDRWHKIPAGFNDDVHQQARVAATMLHGLLTHYKGQVHPAVCAYNAGVGNVDAGIRLHGDPDYWTTHSGSVGYGAEVLARWQWLRSTFGAAPPPAPVTPPGLSAHDRAWLRRALRRIRRLLGRP